MEREERITFIFSLLLSSNSDVKDKFLAFSEKVLNEAKGGSGDENNSDKSINLLVSIPCLISISNSYTFSNYEEINKYLSENIRNNEIFYNFLLDFYNQEYRQIYETFTKQFVSQKSCTIL